MESGASYGGSVVVDRRHGAAAEAAGQRPGRRLLRHLWRKRWPSVRALVGVCWLVVLGTALLVGARQASYADLESGLLSGRVTHVTVSGPTPAVRNGTGDVTLEWREHLVRHRAHVTEASSPRQARAYRQGGNRGVVMVQPVDEALRALAPDAQVGQGRLSYLDGSGWGWEFPAWLIPPVFAAWFASFLVVALGPEPWRATRWAWFWLSTVPGGSLAFLVLSGPTWPLPGRPPGHRRLTGGWALLLTLFLNR